MTKPKKTTHDKQIETWSEALKVAIEYVQVCADKGDETAKRTLMAVMAILYENETEE